MEIRKLEPAAGAEWLLGGFRLFGRSPLGFGLLALSYAGLWLAVMFLIQAAPALRAPLQLVFFVIGPLLLAGMIFAAHEVDHGRDATPTHLLAAIRAGKTGRMISTLLPQIGLIVGCFLLLYVLIGGESFDKLIELFTKLQTQAQTKMPVDPGEFSSLPIGRLLIWVILVLVIGLIGLLFTFTVVPDMMFTDVRLLEAMGRSYRACRRNVLAMLVFMLLGFVLMAAVSMAFALFSALAGMVAGEIGLLIASGLFNGLMAAFAAAVMYYAWKQMLGGNHGDAAASQPTGIEV